MDLKVGRNADKGASGARILVGVFKAPAGIGLLAAAVGSWQESALSVLRVS